MLKDIKRAALEGRNNKIHHKFRKTEEERLLKKT
jgi:hypothetical protein